MTGVAVKVTWVPAQTELAEGSMMTLTGNWGFTAMVTVLDVAGLPVAQVASLVSTQLTASVLTGIWVYVEPVAPEITLPLTFHWYCGELPPLTGVAVKVTWVPAQTGLAEGAIVTLTGSWGFTVMVTVLDVAGLPVAQVTLLVSTQLTASLLTGI